MRAIAAQVSGGVNVDLTDAMFALLLTSLRQLAVCVPLLQVNLVILDLHSVFSRILPLFYTGDTLVERIRAQQGFPLRSFIIPFLIAENNLRFLCTSDLELEDSLRVGEVPHVLSALAGLHMCLEIPHDVVPADFRCRGLSTCCLIHQDRTDCSFACT